MAHPNTLSGLSSNISQGKHIMRNLAVDLKANKKSLILALSICSGWSGKKPKDTKCNKAVGALQVRRKSVGKPEEDKRMGCTDTIHKYSWT